MKDWQKEQIQKCTVELLKEMKCTTLLLEMHKKFGDISFEEFDELESTTTNINKVSKLLRIIGTRVNGYDHLVSTLEQTNQSTAVGLLTNHPLATRERVNDEGLRLSPPQATASGIQQSADPLVGDPGQRKFLDTRLEIIDIVLHVEESPVRTEFLSNWTGLARRLGIPGHTRRSFELERRDQVDLFEDILTAWRSKEGGKATMSNLIAAIRSCGNAEIAESLTKQFLR